MTLRSLLIAGVLALAIASGVQGASAAPQRRVVVVVDASAAKDPAVLSDARAAVAQAGDEAQLRIPRTPTEQLAVTHYFAAQGYTLVIGVGLDHPVAISPVAAKYPNTRFVTVPPGQAVSALR
jgi:basic membrane lipoprotein Med (substrate-binding protein (PBP1-ABC) superfamily)